MASAQLKDPPPGLATPSHSNIDNDESADIPSGVNIENTRICAVAEGIMGSTRSVVESSDSSNNRGDEADASYDAVSMIDNTEDETRRQWTSECQGRSGERKTQKRKRVSNSGKSGSNKRFKSRYVSDDSESDSSSNSSSSSSFSSDSDSTSDNENLDPKPDKPTGKVKIPKHVTKYMVKYATKGIDKKTRQDITNNWPVPDNKSLKGLEVERFFKKNYFKGKKWNGKLESCKINNQLRIFDPLGPLAVLWSEAGRIKKLGDGMDPSDVINFVQRAIVLTGNVHVIYNTERRRATIGKTMPDNLDCISNKTDKIALSKARGDLFGRTFLKHLAKESKDDKHLRELLVPSFNKRNKFGNRGGYKNSNRNNGQFFQNRSANNSQFAGQRQDQTAVQRGRPLKPQNQNSQNNYNKGPYQYQNQGKPAAR